MKSGEVRKSQRRQLLKVPRVWNTVDDGSFSWRNFGYDGPPICFANSDIRRMLRLAKAGNSDLFYDLGCGWGQNLIIAAAEFNVEQCVGIERMESRYRKALRRVERRDLSHRIRIIKGDFEDFLRGSLAGTDPKDATIVLHALETSAKLVERLSKQLNRGCRLVYAFRTLFPEIKPHAVDYPFYVSKVPFLHPASEVDWLTSILQRENHRKSRSAEELWTELYHDYRMEGQTKQDILDYQLRLKAFLRT